MELISSVDNIKIKNYIKLKEKKFRDSSNLFLAYGMHQLNEINDKSRIVDIISKNKDIATILVNDKIIKLFSQTITSIDPVIVVKKDDTFILNDIIVALDGVQNPDNLGSIIRNLVAFNVKNIILSNNSCDIYNEKVIRSSQGALFNIFNKRCELKEEILKLKKLSYTIIGTYPNNNIDVISLKKFNKTNKVCIVFGSEGNGISNEITNLIDIKTTIDINNIESLNLSVSTGIFLYAWSIKK